MIVQSPDTIDVYTELKTIRSTPVNNDVGLPNPNVVANDPPLIVQGDIADANAQPYYWTDPPSKGSLKAFALAANPEAVPGVPSTDSGMSTRTILLLGGIAIAVMFFGKRWLKG